MRASLTVYRWELRKLLAQPLVVVAVTAAALAPVIYVFLLSTFQRERPEAEDGWFAPQVLDTGLAIPLFQLHWGMSWFLPGLTAIVASSIFAREDELGTLKTFLTRSVSRSQVFVGKALAAATHAALTLTLLLLVGLVAGAVQFGSEPLMSPSRTVLGAGNASLLIIAGFALTAIPMLAFAAIGLLFSVLTRSSIAAVVAVMATLPLMAGLGLLFPELVDYMLRTQFDAWQTLFYDPIDWEKVLRAVWVSALYGLPALAGAHLLFRRRDVTSG